MNDRVKSSREDMTAGAHLMRAETEAGKPEPGTPGLSAAPRFRAHKKTSISLELTGLVLGSLLVAALFFLAANRFSGWYISKHYETSDYIQSRNREMAAELQEYISENGLSSTDREALNRWVKKKSVISIHIFRDGYLIYDSGDPDSEEEWLSSEEEYGGWETLEPLLFSDGYAYLILYGNYAYQMSTIALIAELVLAFVLFMGGILFVIRRTIRYIRQLKQEIQLLETGSLNYPITIRGRDELTELAEGLDAMRVSLKAQMEEETRVTVSHQRIITEMSHDLRTPLTSILLFAEIIQKEGAQDPEKTLNYVQKIDRKARQMKNLTEKIFAYSMAGAGSTEGADTKAESGSTARRDTRTESGSTAGADVRAESGSAAGADTRADFGSAAGADTRADSGSTAGAAAKAESGRIDWADAKPDFETTVRADAKAESGSASGEDAKAGSGNTVGADIKTESGSAIGACGKPGSEAASACSFKSIFFDVLSEIGTCLEQSGFCMEWDIAWSEAGIRADEDSVGRIADNLVSNLLKYADPSGTVRIRTKEDAVFVCLIFENTARQLQEKPDSTGIGVPNIRRMMESMGGKCEITQTEPLYRTMLYFRKV